MRLLVLHANYGSDYDSAYLGELQTCALYTKYVIIWLHLVFNQQLIHVRLMQGEVIDP